MARIAVIGVGGIGAVFGGQLHAVGHDVLFCSRRPLSKLTIESDTIPLRTPVRCVVEPDRVPVQWRSAEWILVAVKAHQNPHIASWLQRLSAATTRVVTLQNGIDNATGLAQAGCSGAFEAVVYCGAESARPGEVRHTGSAQLVVRDGEVGHDLRRLFEDTAVTISLSQDFDTVKWRKLMVNSVANGITALTRRPLGVLGRPPAAALARELLRECLPIAVAHGARLTRSDIDDVLAGLCRPEARGVLPSMYQDRLAGRPTEHDAIYGAVVRAAERKCLSAPLHRWLDQLLSAGEP